MGRKVSPIGLRLGIHKGWASRWFGGAKYAAYLKDDLNIRTFLKKRLKNMGVDSVHIDRGNNAVRVTIVTARPGLIIGRGGAGIQELQGALAKKLNNTVPLQLEVVEVKSPDSSAAVVAEHLIDQIEKRTPYRRLMRMTMTKIMRTLKTAGRPPSRSSLDEVIDRYCYAPCLVIDDVGMGGSGSDWEWGQLEEIVNERYRERLMTIMATNRDLDQLPERIVSRFDDAKVGTIVLNSGEDYRRRRV